MLGTRESRNQDEEAIGWGRGSQEGFTEEASCVGRPFQEEGPDGHPKFADMNSWETRGGGFPGLGRVFTAITADTRLLWTFYNNGNFTRLN